MNRITCLTSSAPSESTSQIIISLDSSTVSGGSFSYSESVTPYVDSIDATESAILGGELLTIRGQSFGMLWGNILIGEGTCKIKTWNRTTIQCYMPSNQHGDYPVLVSVPDRGFANIEGIPSISYTFIVTSMLPSTGSVLGGNIVKFAGRGFGSCDNIVIEMGSSANCDILNCSDQLIECRVKKKVVEHLVTNGGRHPTLGAGYAWDKQDLTINPGDAVKWQWNLLVSGDNIGVNIHQTNGESNQWDGKGFNSGAK